jgi:hypothetical protein
MINIIWTYIKNMVYLTIIDAVHLYQNCHFQLSCSERSTTELPGHKIRLPIISRPSILDDYYPKVD